MKKFALSFSVFLVFVGAFHLILINNTAQADGLAFDNHYLWYSDASETIYKLDPWAKGNKIVQTFTGAPGQGGDQNVRWRDLAWDGSYLWVASWANESGNADTSRIYRMNPDDGSIVSFFDAPFEGHADGMAWDGTYLWIGDEDNHSIYEVDSSNGAIISSFSVPPANGPPDPRGLAWDGNYIWAGYQDDGTIKKYDSTNGSVIASFDSPLGWTQQGLAYDGEYLWAAGGTTRNESGVFGDPLICQIDPFTGKEVFSFTPFTPQDPDSGAPVPEPATIILLGTGLLGLAGVSRRKFKKR